MRVAVELVPRDAAGFQAQLADLATLSKVDLVNVPDLAHFAMRGWEAAVTVRAFADGRYRAVPHLRAMDVDLG
ncbi:MAG TPA: methylenetetrahydrofolate reductase, partial [Trueperaceae bacterium]|nr:methylenetetrahydrofolate reductase [Trueperaceae bacterium]